GRIPISVVVGDEEAMHKAKQLGQEAWQSNTKLFIASHNRTLDANQREIIMPFDSLHQRIKALLRNNLVEELIIVVQTYELLQTGLPIDNIDEIVIINNNLQHINKVDNSFESLISLLQSVC
ncbi:MAG: carboxylate--amine ligase, partial [Campylobacterales bacterium]|nr:carboxylate--amine ligase [Campylobacterales bacterium]